MSGSMRVQVFPQGDNENDLRLDVWFDTDVVCGCTDPVAMNYDAGANYNDGSCLYPGASMSWRATSTRGPTSTTARACTSTIAGSA